MIAFGVSFGLALALTGPVIVLLRRWAVLDRPNARSSHAVVTPRGGGVAVIVAVFVCTALVGSSDAWPVVVPALLLAIVGLADDLRSLSARVRLAAQVLVGAGMGTWLAATAHPLGPPLALFLAVVVVGVVGFVNAFNFMDGINGISALNAVLGGAWFAWLGHSHDAPALALIGSAVAGAALGFLPWNAASRVFLGDVGSYGLGALLVGAAILTWALGLPTPLAVAPLLVYLADTSWVVVRRALAGKPLMEAHREHAYQRLVHQGWPHLAAAAWCAGVSGAIVLVMASFYPDNVLAASAIAGALLIAYLTTPLVGERLRGERIDAT